MRQAISVGRDFSAAHRLANMRAGRKAVRPVPVQHAQCPQPAPWRESTFARTLHRACLILGGLERAAAHFGLPVQDLRSWMEGRAQPPESVFLAALEVLLLHLDGGHTAQ